MRPGTASSPSRPRRTSDPLLIRSWAALAAIGAGLIHLGVAAGSPVPMLALGVLVGAAETVWGVLALARRAVPAARAALAGAVALTGAFTVALFLPAAVHRHESGGVPELPLGALAGASTLDLAVAVFLALGLRRGSAGAEGRPGRYLLATGVAAAAVAAVTVTSLAGTAVGAHQAH